MKIEIDLDALPIASKAEILRSLVFDEKTIKTKWGDYKETGCYDTFKTHPEFVKIDAKSKRNLYDLLDWDASDYMDSPFVSGLENDNIFVNAVESPSMIAMWYWEGDGTLLVHIKGEKYAYINNDCKNDYDWEEKEVK